MAALAPELRNKLERTVIEARDVAETGARVALEALAVHHHEPYPHQTPEQRKLRNHLRARARQLGDPQTAKGSLTINHLMHQCAYEHWHRMLFARFLAENDLLIEPSSGVAISLQECEELANEAKTDLWTYASRCAQQMLPQIFRPDDPLLQVTLATEHRVKLERLLAGLAPATFKAHDSLGWVYQFWQSKKKGEVNASGRKIGADELPAVTQLFTEDYMVDFLLDNTLGAWWAGKVLAANPKLAESAKSEEELRKAGALPSVPWTYLRFIKGKDGKWRPAAGTFEGWPKTAKELKCLDPCMGSGHFVVAMFERLVALRMAEEELTEKAIVEAVIRDNLFGLEIDPRCTQIGAFNLALGAWRRVGHCPLPIMHLACSGLGVAAKKEEWLALAQKSDKLRSGMEGLYQLFQKAPVLGSLIDPRQVGGDLLVAGFRDLQPLLEQALKREATDDAHEMAVTAKGVAEAAEILAGQFALIATNVPYLNFVKQAETLKSHCEAAFPNSKADLATCFVERCVALTAKVGSVALVTPHNWLFLGSYRKLRKKLLEGLRWNFVARLGPRAFETISGEVVNVALMSFSNGHSQGDSVFPGLDASEEATVSEKAACLRCGDYRAISQRQQLSNPDCRLVLENVQQFDLLRKYADSFQGICTGDFPSFGRNFWEMDEVSDDWKFQQTTVEATTLIDGLCYVFLWENGSGQFKEFLDLRLGEGAHGAWVRGLEAWGHVGVCISQTGQLNASLYLGQAFDNNAAVIIAKDKKHLPALWAFCSSDDYPKEVRKIDQALKVTNITLLKVPFDLAHWQKVAAEKYPHGLPRPFSTDPTQWLFNGHPKGADHPLHVAVTRLLDYHWPRQTGSSFQDCPTLAPDGLEKLADADGIVCISSVRGKEPAADRLRKLLAAAYGKDWKPTTELELIRATGSNTADLEEWLRNEFFQQHCGLVHQRPFIWHIWDGRKRDGFHALVNSHKLAEGDGKGRKLLESLTYSYLGEWITRQQDGIKQGEDGAEDRLAAALELRKRLIAILEGQPPFDLFVRWKPLHGQPIGWEPDINDGVRINIRPFTASDLPNGRTGAGVLRWKPNIKWEKDRGKEPDRPKADFPWFWGWDGKTLDLMGGKEFTGERVNDLHYSLDFKRQARARNLKGEKAER